MKHVVSFSGGKDSTAMLLMMLERGMPIDDIVYFDCGDWEFPQMHEHIRQVEKYIGREVTRIRNKRGDLNYWMFDHASKPRGNNPVRVGMAWPQITVRWCTARKMDTIEAYYSRHKPELTVYIGFAADELSRLSSKNIIEKHWYQMQFPLVNWEITEEEALKYCHSKGFTWGGYIAISTAYPAGVVHFNR